MDKKKQFLTTLLITMAVVFLAQWYMGRGGCDGKSPEEPAAPATNPASVDSVDSVDSGGGAAGSLYYDGKPLNEVEIATNSTQQILLGSLDPDGDYKFQAELDPRGASVYTLKLAGHYDTDSHKRKADKTDQELREWSYSLLNPVVDGENTILPFSTESIRVGDRDIGTYLSRPHDVSKDDGTVVRRRLAWAPRRHSRDNLPGNRHFVETDEDGTQKVVFTLAVITDKVDEDGNPVPMCTLEKTYTLAKGADALGVSLRVVNKTGAAQPISVVQYGPTGTPREGLRGDNRNIVAGVYSNEEEEIRVPKVLLNTDDDVEAGAEEQMFDEKNPDDPVIWCGQGNQFFASLMYPIPRGVSLTEIDDSTDPADMAVPEDEYTFTFHSRMLNESEDSKTQVAVFRGEVKEVANDEAAVWNYQVYCGPKSRTVLKNTPLYAKLNYAGAIKFAGCSWCTFEPLAFAVMIFIEYIGDLLGNYGLSIILLVVLIRLALHPISKKSQINMRKMSKMGPLMKKIEEKYADDKAAQQKAKMELFRQQGATPILGCLPMMLQMPIWVALWSGLQAAVELRHEGLLPFWITDLAGRDALITLSQPFTIPLLGGMIGPISSFNLLPLLLCVAMVLQQKFTPMQAATSPEQKQQQRMMMIMMPVMMLVFFYNAPSGLTLYIMISTAAGVVESHVIRKHLKEKEELEAALEVTVQAPGRAARGQRPKKPKGSGGSRYK